MQQDLFKSYPTSERGFFFSSFFSSSLKVFKQEVPCQLSKTFLNSLQTRNEALRHDYTIKPTHCTYFALFFALKPSFQDTFFGLTKAPPPHNSHHVGGASGFLALLLAEYAKTCRTL